jgi:hypothetical protein
VVPSPTPDLVPYVARSFEQTIEEEPEMRKSLEAAYENFLREAVMLLYTYHRVEDARGLFAKLQERYPSEDAAVSFEAFVMDRLAERMEGMTSRNALMLIEGLLSQSYGWQALGDEERAAGYFQLAVLYYRKFMLSLKPGEHADRLSLPPFGEVVRLTLERMPAERLGPNARARLGQLRREAEAARGQDAAPRDAATDGT